MLFLAHFINEETKVIFSKIAYLTSGRNSILTQVCLIPQSMNSIIQLYYFGSPALSDLELDSKGCIIEFPSIPTTQTEFNSPLLYFLGKSPPYTQYIVK